MTTPNLDFIQNVDNTTNYELCDDQFIPTMTWEPDGRSLEIPTTSTNTPDLVPTLIVISDA
jgi:hypothetical protein